MISWASQIRCLSGTDKDGLRKNRGIVKTYGAGLEGGGVEALPGVAVSEGEAAESEKKWRSIDKYAVCQLASGGTRDRSVDSHRLCVGPLPGPCRSVVVRLEVRVAALEGIS